MGRGGLVGKREPAPRSSGEEDDMAAADGAEQGRKLYERGSWGGAYDALVQADAASPLEPDDLERLATAAYLTGHDDESAEAWARAHRAHLEAGRTERAVRCAFWLAFGLLQRGERARGGGWVARAERLLEECGPDCVERGYLLIPLGLRAIGEGDGRAAYDAFCRAAEIGERFEDPDLAALGLHSRGRVLIRLGELEAGVRLLDEAMAAVDARAVSPLVVGDVYCSVIEGCLEIFDLGRAQEWTAALTRWCDEQEGLVPYRGQCLVRRAEILELHGDWDEALDEARRAEKFLTRPPGEPAAAAACYRCGEVLRLKGDFPGAEAAYRESGRWAGNAQPGLALLRLAEGRVSQAEASIRQAATEATARHARARLLPAWVEIMLGAGRIDEARSGAEELARISDELGAPLLDAAAARAEGAVLLAGGDAKEALPPLRRAADVYRTIGAPYEVARVRVLVGRALHELGDRDGAELELAAAREAFRKLGAGPDLARAEDLLRPARRRRPGGLTPRETEVLRLVASGNTNRAIAKELFIAEKTVARHVSNIFLKLGVSNRSAATAWAYENDLVGGRDGAST